MEKENTNKIKVKYPEIRKVLQELYGKTYRSGRSSGNEDGYDFSTAYEKVEKLIDNRNRLVYVGKDGWSVEGIIGKPMKTFRRRLFLTKRIMRYKTWLKRGGCKINFR